VHGSVSCRACASDACACAAAAAHAATRPRNAQIRQGDNPAFQFKTHPNIDKAGYGNGVLGLKDPSRPFPTGARAAGARLSAGDALGALPHAGRCCVCVCALCVCAFAPRSLLLLTHRHTGHHGRMHARTHAHMRTRTTHTTGSELGVLKWRFQSRDEELVPLTINAWPSASGARARVGARAPAGGPRVHAARLCVCVCVCVCACNQPLLRSPIRQTTAAPRSHHLNIADRRQRTCCRPTPRAQARTAT
jgi:hypothetical protein